MPIPKQNAGPEERSTFLNNAFTYHAPTPEQFKQYDAINAAAKAFADVVLTECPDSGDRTAAIRLIREARMTANAAIATNGAL